MKHIAATIIAVCALVTASRAQSDAQPQWRWRTETISKDVSSLEVQDTGGSLVVLLYGKSFPDSVQLFKPFKPFENTTAEVWLLRHDGAAQPRLGNPPAKIGVGNAGSSTEIMSFDFARSSPKDLAAVVVSVNGEMFVRKVE